MRSVFLSLEYLFKPRSLANALIQQQFSFEGSFYIREKSLSHFQKFYDGIKMILFFLGIIMMIKSRQESVKIDYDDLEFLFMNII